MKSAAHAKEYLKVDKELVIILLMVAITAILFFFVVNQRAFLNFFYLPVLMGAYLYGKRYATLYALASVLLIGIVSYAYPEMFTYNGDDGWYKWLDIGTWGGFLIIAGYLMGLLYEKKEEAAHEIRKTYVGIVEMLSLIIDSVDQQTQSHSYRVSVISALMAEQVGLSSEEVEQIRVAALLHDLGKIGVSAEILQKVGALNKHERSHMHTHTDVAVDILEPVGGKVIELLPLILHHHEKYDGTGYNALMGSKIPIGARIIAVADVYDALISDRPYRKAMTHYQAMTEITNNSGVHFDPIVVHAFEAVCPRLESESYLMTMKYGYASN